MEQIWLALACIISKRLKFNPPHKFLSLFNVKHVFTVSKDKTITGMYTLFYYNLKYLRRCEIFLIMIWQKRTFVCTTMDVYKEFSNAFSIYHVTIKLDIFIILTVEYKKKNYGRSDISFECV